MDSPQANQKRIEVAAGLVFHQQKLLITQRPANGHLANLWEFPGGKRENTESFAHCLHRELMEELGITVAELELLEEVTHEYPEKTVRIQFIRCRLAGGLPQPLVCQGFRWVSPQELTTFPFPAADVRIIGRLQTESALWTESG